MNKKRKALREGLGKESLLVAPGAADVLSARLVEASGFPAVYMSGSLQHRMAGFPDVNVLTMSEMAATAAAISRAIDIPTIADGETGFGLAINVKRMVREYEQAGVSAIHIEDLTVPKRPDYLGFDSPTVSRSEFLDKIKAALDTRQDESLIIIARSELKGDFKEKLERLQECVEAGADAFWFSTRDEEEMRRLRDTLQRPGFGVIPGGTNVAEYRGRGADCGVVPAAMALSALVAQRRMLLEFRESGLHNQWLEEQSGFAEARQFFMEQGMKEI